MQALLVLLLGLGLGADAKDEAIKKDLDNLKGNWSIVSAEREGNAVDKINDDKISIEGNTLTVKHPGGKQEKLTLKIDPTTKPKLIDLTPTEGNEKDQV